MTTSGFISKLNLPALASSNPFTFPLKIITYNIIKRYGILQTLTVRFLNLQFYLNVIVH